MRRFFYFILVSLLPGIIFSQVNIYVDSSKATNGNGSSWADAYKDLNDAIKYANEGSGKFDIHVAQGTYKPNHVTQNGSPYPGQHEVPIISDEAPDGAQEVKLNFISTFLASNVDSAYFTIQEEPTHTTVIESGPRHETFAIKRAGIRIFGGYPTNGGTRNPALYTTYLDGDLGIYKVYHVMFVGGYSDNFMTDSIVVDGFTLRNGYSNGPGVVYGGGFGIPESKGGGLTVLFTSGATGTDKFAVRNCTFENNAAHYGGALFMSLGNSFFSNCKFLNNRADFVAGAVYNVLDSVTFSDCLFDNDSSSDQVGAVLNFRGAPKYLNCTFSNNKSNHTAVMASYESNPLVQNCIFNNNKSYNFCGAVSNYYGTPEFSNCQFNNNEAVTYAGAMYNFACGIKLMNTSFTGNKAVKRAGALFYNKKYSGDQPVTNCTFTNNYTTDTTDFVEGLGGALLIDSMAAPRFSNCTFSGNHSYRVGVSLIQAGSAPMFTNCEFTNNYSNYSVSISENDDSKVVYKGCKFLNNDCNPNTNTITGFGVTGSVLLNLGNTSFSNCIFYDNNADNNTYNHLTTGIVLTYDSLTLANCVFASNPIYNGAVINAANNSNTIIDLSTFFDNGVGPYWKPSFRGDGTSNLKITNSVLKDNGGFINTTGSYTIKNICSNKSYYVDTTKGVMTNFIAADPMFYDESKVKGPDNLFGTADDGIRLKNGSPCINKGNNSLSAVADTVTDISGDVRIYNDTIDMGAYEHQPYIPGSVLSFSGMNEHIALPHFTMPNNLTLEVKANIKQTGTLQNIVSWYGSNYASLGVDPAGYFFFRIGKAQEARITSNVKVDDSQWHTFTITKDSLAAWYVNLFLDGNLVGSGSLNPSGVGVSNPLSSSALYIGTRNNTGEYFKGEIDEIKIRNRLLCGGEISQNAGCNELYFWIQFMPDMLAYYKFNQGFGNKTNVGQDTLIDETDYARNGLLKNFILTDTTNWLAINSGLGSGACFNYSTDIIDTWDPGPSYPGDSIQFPLDIIPLSNNGFTHYYWTGPNGFVSNLQKPVLDNVTIFSAGIYSVTASDKGCERTDTFSLEVNTYPANALDFDGSCYVQSPYAQLNSSYTFQAKVRTDIAGIDNPIISWSGANNNLNVLYIDTAGKLAFKTSSGNITVLGIAGDSVINNDKWHFIDLIKSDDDSNNVKLFVDGANVKTFTATISPVTNSCRIGQWPNYRNFYGRMDEIRIWNRPLSCDQERSAYMNPIDSSITGLEVYYRCNEGQHAGDNSGLSLLDKAGGDHNGVFNNFKLNGSLTANYRYDYNVNDPGIVVGAYAGPDIQVLGNGTEITDGDNSPSASDNTNMGNVELGTSVSKQFIIKNNSSVNWLLVNDVSFTGPNANSFSVDFSSFSVQYGSQDTITVTYNPLGGVTGLATCVINLASNDCDNPSYTFTIQATSITGTPGASLHFGGPASADYITVSNPLNTSAVFSYELMFNIDPSNANGGTLFSQEGALDATANLPVSSKIYLTNTHAVCYQEKSGSNLSTVNSICTNPVPVNQWHHVAVSRKPGTNAVKLYLNGSLIGSATMTSTEQYLRAVIGDDSVYTSTSPFYGKLDEIRVWNRYLCLNEIQNNKNCEIGPLSPGLLAYYQFNQGVGYDGTNVANNTGITTLVDVSPNGKHGTFSQYFVRQYGTSNFLSAGGVNSGNSCTIYNPSDMIVMANNNIIANNDNTPSLADNTDFSSIDFGATIVKGFTVVNAGSGVLSISGNPRVVLTGNSAFMLSQDASAVVAGNSSSTFKITFAPLTTGIYPGTITIYSDDCDNPVYTFSISATATTGSPTGRYLNFSSTAYASNASPVGLPINNEPYTIEFMMRKFVYNGSDRGYISWGNTSGNNGQTGVYIWGNANIRHGWGNSPENYLTTYSNVDIYDTIWDHIAATYDGTMRRIFINGELRATDTPLVAHAVTSAGTLKIGQMTVAGSTVGFPGDMDEVRIWNRTLCQAELLNGIGKELVGVQNGLVAYYQFNQGYNGLNNSSITTLRDTSGNGNHCTLNGFALTGTNSNFLAPGSVENGAVAAAINPGTIDIYGQGLLIPFQDISPDTLDGTDFGNVYAISTPATKIFQIKNTSSNMLSLYGNPKVIVTGTGFSVANDANPAGVMPGGIENFKIAFAPSIPGLHTGTVTVHSNDCSKEYYTFQIQGNSIMPARANALAFDGVNDYFRETENFDMLGQKLTFEAIVYVKSASDGGGIISIADPADANTVELLINSAGNLRAQVYGSGGASERIRLDGSSNIVGGWHHVAMTVNGNDIKLFVDGEEENTTFLDNNPISGLVINGRPLQYGTDKSTTKFTEMEMDEARVWFRELCPTEIIANKGCMATNSGDSLIALFNFNYATKDPNSEFVAYNEANNDTITVASNEEYGLSNGTLNNFALSGSVSNFVTRSSGITGNCPLYKRADATIKGNSITIVRNDNSPQASDNTDFGYVSIGGSKTNSFTITNSGISGSILALNGSPNVIVTGTGFTLNTDAVDSIASGQTKTFSIDFNPYSAGTFTGTVTIYPKACSEDAYSFAIQGTSLPGEALHFDGTDDRVNLGTTLNSVLDTLNVISVEAWIYPSNTSGYGCIVGNYQTGSPEMQFLLRRDGAGITFWVDNGSGFSGIGTGAILATNTWYHVAGVWDGARLKVYINGLLNNSVNGPSGNLKMSSNPVLIGSNDIGELFTGKIDEVRIWGRALCDAEVANNYNKELSSGQTGLLAYYKFNQGAENTENLTISTLTDSSGNGYNGTLTNFALNGSSSNWVNGGGVVTGSLTPLLFPANLNVFGNNIEIQNNDNTPSGVDNTDFGNVVITGNNSKVLTYTVTNNGVASLTFTASPKVTVSGTGFSLLTDITSQTLTSGQSSNFQIAFDPSSLGVSAGTITINTNNCDDPVQTFSIQGTGINPSEASALHLDGTDDFVDCGNDSALNITGTAITVEAWINATSWKTNSWEGSIVAKDQDNSTGYVLRAGNNGSLSFVLGDGSNWPEAVTGPVMNTNTWYHVAATYDGANITIFVNGYEETSAAVSAPIAASANNLFIGASPAFPFRFFHGAIDEVRIWNRVLSKEEIRHFMNCERDSSTSGLVAYYKFNQGLELSDNSAITSLSDASAANSDGTLNNFTLNSATSNWVNPSALISGSGCSACELVANLTVTACDSYTSPSGKTWTTSGSYTDTIFNVGDCDSIFSINLIINPIYNISVTDSVCNGDSYTFPDGTTLNNITAPVSHTNNLLSQLACDSIVVTNLLIFNATSSTQNVTECDSAYIHGKWYNSSQTIIDTLTSSTGCDSIVTTNLTIPPGIHNSNPIYIPQTACDSFTWYGTTYYASGNYVKEFINSAGCDSTFTLQLTINNSSTGDTTVSGCGSFVWYGTTYTTSGDKIHIIPNVAGCDSVITLHLTLDIDDQTVTAQPFAVCDSGNSVITLENSQTGVYYTLRNAADSSIVAGPFAGTGDSISFNTGTLDTTETFEVTAEKNNNYAVNFPGPNDRVKFDNVYNSFARELTVEAWIYVDQNYFMPYMGQSDTTTFNANDATWFLSGTTIHYFNLITADGNLVQLGFGGGLSANSWVHIAYVVDSTGIKYYKNGILSMQNYTPISPINNSPSMSIILGKYALASDTNTQTIFNSNASIDEFRVWNVARTGTEISSNRNSCLTGNEPGLVHYTRFDEESGNVANSLVGPNGTVINPDTNLWLPSANGCNEFCTKELSQKATVLVTHPGSTTQITNACNSYTWSANNMTYSASGIYSDTVTGIGGCDSVVTLNLTINSPTAGSETITACDSFIWYGTTYTSSGTPTHILTNAAGCDSVITLNLTINSSNSISETIAACENYIWPANNTTYDTSGTYTATLSNTSGCDSVVTLNLTINSIVTNTQNLTACDSVQMNGNWYINSQTLTDTLQTATGCDSIVIINLIINNSTADTVVLTICSNDSVMVGGTYQNITGYYYDSLVTVTGCDSIIITNLIVNTPSYALNPVQICIGDSLFTGGGWQTAPGSYYDTLISAGGCDSIVETQLAVLDTIFNSVTISICQGDSIYAGGYWQSAAGIFYDTLTALAGCDSIVTTNLSVSDLSGDINCNGTYDNGEVAGDNNNDGIIGTGETAGDTNGDGTIGTGEVSGDTNGNGTIGTGEVAGDSNGDGIIGSGEISGDIDGNGTIGNGEVNGDANGDGVIGSGEIAGDSNGDGTIGTGEANGDANGNGIADCGDKVLLGIPEDSTINVSVCNGDSVFAQSAYQTLDGTYYDTLATIFNCDSIVITNLTVIIIANNLNISICTGDSIFAQGVYQYNSGIYSDTLIAVSGCDSVVVTNLSVVNSIENNVSISICSGDSVYAGGEYQYTAGTYYDTTAAAFGCDSVIITDLSVLNTATNTISISICNGDSIFVQGIYQYNAGIYYDTLISVSGCDSVVVNNLSVVNSIENNSSIFICSGDSVFAGGAYQYISGTYYDTLTAASGCDSIITLNLDVVDTIQAMASISVCEGQSYIFGSQTLNTAGIYSETFVSVGGCDSIVTLNFSINNIDSISITSSICNGDSISFNGIEYTSAGTYYSSLIGMNGCDSIVSLILTVNNEDSIITSDSICIGDSYNFNGSVYTVGGIYTADLTNVNGCDSTVTLTLSVTQLPVINYAISQDTICNNENSLVLTATPAGGNFYGTSVIGNNFDPTSITNSGYIVISYSYQDANGCSDSLSDSIYVDICSGIAEQTAGKVWIYPNPNTGLFSLQIPEGSIVTILHTSGTVAYKEKLHRGTHRVNLKNISKGIYFIQLVSANFSKTIKIVITD